MAEGKEYNGFSPAIRQQVWEVQKKLKRDGVISWDDKACCICGEYGGVIMPHLENYLNPKDFLPCCIECHMNLHGRFKSPGGWVNFLIKLREGYKPKRWYSFTDFFGSKENKEYFYRSKEIPTFEPDPAKWYENLSLVPVNLVPEYEALQSDETNNKIDDTELTDD